MFNSMISIISRDIPGFDLVGDEQRDFALVGLDEALQ